MPPRVCLMSVPYTALDHETWYLEAEFLPAENPGHKLAIICHPHPLFGGEMHNNVVDAIFSGLSDEYNMVRFNFSGVGGSDGGHENGQGEIGQVKAVVEYTCGELVQEQSCEAWNRIHVIGYSFGAAMALPAALAMNNISSCTAIAFPFEMFSKHATESIALQAKSKASLLFLTGDADDFTPITSFNKWMTKFSGSVQSIIQGADHFFVGHERRLVAEIKKFLNSFHQDRS
ncbi:MAG: alpha/beta hydrolase [Candidatus Sigynarchaeota archaeon]